MNTKVIQRPELIQCFEGLQHQFSQALIHAQQQDQKFKQSCIAFQNNVLVRLDKSLQSMSDKNPLYAQVHTFKEILEQRNSVWNKKIEQQDTGVHFRSGFNDSLLIFIYGKVKSGKSSLGNYMAWGNTDPTDELKKKTAMVLHPKYFSEKQTDVSNGDAKKEAEDKREFRVGATEATSSIQGFRLPGLTWIDSPGLHSINSKNGDLAKEYVEHADIILYTMKSDSPGRQSDLREILELYRADKKIILLVTGSDTTETVDFDENDNPINHVVMKDAKTCLQQREYIRCELEKIPELAGKSKNIEIISFSARYAQMFQNDPEQFLNSGMGQFFNEITTVAQDDGVKLKQQTPIKNFKHFLSGFKLDIQQYQQDLTSFNSPIQRIKDSLPIKINEYSRGIQTQMREFIQVNLAKLERYRDDSNEMNLQFKQFSAKLNKKYAQLLQDTQTNILQEVMSDLGNSIVQVVESDHLLNLPEFKNQERTERVTDRVQGGTKMRNGGIGAVVGLGVGATLGSFVPVIGTAIGAEVGSVIGGYLGGLSGDNASVEYREISVKTGDNFYQLQQEINQKIQESIAQNMEQFKSKVIDVAVNNAKQLIESVEHELHTFQKSIQQLSHDIESTIK